MDVDLKYGKLNKRVCNINLHEGCRPRVGTDAGKSPPESQMLEPAIWFKCLLITYIHVDCDQRRVRFRKISQLSTVSDSDTWRTGRHTDSPSETHGELLSLHTATTRDDSNDSSRLRNLSTDSIYEVYDDGECYDFDCLIDEFFNQATDNLIDFNRGVLSQSDFNICVLRLLHCFILPSVKFMISDLPILLMAQDYINHQVVKAEERILKQDKMVFNTESSLKSQRERLFRTENFLSESNVRNCKTDFLSILLKDVEKDIFKNDRILDEYQQKINDVKAASGDVAEPLVSLRKERDNTHQQLDNLEHIRENIKNVIVRPVSKKKKFKKKKQQNIFHDIYVEVYKKLNEQKETLQNMCFQKVKIVTVREAIILSIRDVQTVGETVGIEIKIDGSERATDIFDVKLKPDSWKTYEEKVALILSNPKQESCQIHKIFCDRIRDRIKAAIGEYTLFRSETLKNGACTEVKISHTERELLNQSGLSSHRTRYYLPINNNSFHASLNRKCSDSMELPVMRDASVDERFPLDQKMSDVSINDQFCTLPLKSSIDTFRSDIHTQIQHMCRNVLPAAFEHSEISLSKLWLIYENHLYQNLMNDIIELYSVAYEAVCNHLITNLFTFSVSEFVNEGSFSQRFLLGQDMSSFSASAADSLENTDDENDEVDNEKTRLSMSMDELKWRSDMMEDLYRGADEDCSSLMESIKLSFDSRRNSMKSTKTQSSSDSAESYHDAMPEINTVEPSDVQIKHMSPTKNDEYDLTIFKRTFSPALLCIDNMLVTSSIVGKLRCLTRIFRFLGTTISTVCSSENSDYLACSDDILTTTILLLVLLVDHQKLKQFYVQLMTMVDLMAPCLIGGIHDCSLTNFYSAFHFIFSHIVLKSRRS